MVPILNDYRFQTFITTGDELALHNACERASARLEIGGSPTPINGSAKGFERPPEFGQKGRTDWMVTYIHTHHPGMITSIRTLFLEFINNANADLKEIENET